MNAQNMFWHKMRFRTQEEPKGLAPRLSVLQSCRRQRARAAAVTADLLVPLSTARNPKAGQLLTAGDQHKHSQQHLAILKQNIYTSWDQIDWTQHAATPSGLDLVILVSVPTLTIPWPCKIPQPAGTSWDGDSLAECWEEEGEGGKKLRGLPLWGEKGNEATQTAQQTLIRLQLDEVHQRSTHIPVYNALAFTHAVWELSNSVLCFTTGWLVRDLLAQSISSNESAVSNSEAVPQHTATRRELLEATESILQQGNKKGFFLFVSVCVNKSIRFQYNNI